MLKNYFTSAFRSIRRNLSFTLLNIFGLSLGIVSCLTIFLIVRNELGYDNFSRKAGRTYRITLNALDFNSNISMAIVPAMRNDFPELENITQIFYQREGLVKIGQNKFMEKSYAYVDNDFPKIFDFQWISGNPATALSEPNSVVLTETTAQKYFGTKPAMGETINLENQFTVKVKGIIKDPPGNTSLPFNFLVSLNTQKFSNGIMTNFYAIMGASCAYLVIPENYSIHQLEKKIPAFITKNWGKDIASEAHLPLQPIRDIHFDQRYINSIITPVSRDTYWGLAVIAVFIIVMACINFINLSTAQSIKRSKEVGVRKVMGAGRPQLIQQFLGETSILVLISVIAGLAITILTLPEVTKWLDIKIDTKQLSEPIVLGLLLSVTVGIILLAGLYPAFVQSAFNPVESLKRKTNMSFRGINLRKGLVLLQFAISQILIVGTLVVAHQMNFFQNEDLGFNKEAVVSFGIPDGSKKDILKQQLKSEPGLTDISFSSGAPAYFANATSFACPELGLMKDDVTEVKCVDENYTDMFGLKMLAGEKISRKYEKDTTIRMVINETMMHKLGIQNPAEAIGKKIRFGWGDPSYVIGVVQDFQSESKHKKRRACVLLYSPDNFYMASVRIKPTAIHQTIGHIDKIWSAIFPKDVFEYEFIDEHIASWYKQEAKVYTAFKLFSSLAILIGCLGLYGLVSFSAVQRTKEVGIRKVLGASIFDISALFAREFVFLIALAFLIAIPVGYYFMHSWLENFAYHIGIGKGIFLIAVGISFAIALITISFQAIKAALANPVTSLRSE
jgi:putative ABC transport system permease protein